MLSQSAPATWQYLEFHRVWQTTGRHDYQRNAAILLCQQFPHLGHGKNYIMAILLPTYSESEYGSHAAGFGIIITPENN